MFYVKKRWLLDYVAVSLIFITSGTVSGFMLNASKIVPFFVLFAIFFSIRNKTSFERKPLTYFIVYTTLLLCSYVFVSGSHGPSDFSVFLVYLMLALGAFLILQSIDYGHFKEIYLDIATFIAITSIVLFILHQINLIPTTYAQKPGSSITFMMFAFNNFGWKSSFNRLAGPYWEPGAFQIVLNYALLLYFHEISKFQFDKKIAIKFIVVVIAILMTKSSAGYINLAVFAGIMMTNSSITKKNLIKWISIISVSVFSIFSMVSSDAVQDKMAQKGYEGTSYEIRKADNLAMLQMSYEKPLYGYGVVSSETRNRGKVLGNRTSSNGILSITSQMGCVFLILCMIALYSSLKKFFPSKQILILLLVLMLHSTEVFFYFPISFIFFFNRRGFVKK